MSKQETTKVINKAKKKGYDCQLTHWLPKYDFDFIRRCMETVARDEKRKQHVYSCKIYNQIHFALFVNDVGEHGKPRDEVLARGKHRMHNRRDSHFQ